MLFCIDHADGEREKRRKAFQRLIGKHIPSHVRIPQTEVGGIAVTAAGKTAADVRDPLHQRHSRRRHIHRFSLIDPEYGGKRKDDQRKIDKSADDVVMLAPTGKAALHPIKDIQKEIADRPQNRRQDRAFPLRDPVVRSVEHGKNRHSDKGRHQKRNVNRLAHSGIRRESYQRIQVSISPYIILFYLLYTLPMELSSVFRAFFYRFYLTFSVGHGILFP